MPPPYRLEYVRSELRANNFRIGDSALFERVALEVAYAIWSPVHENAQPTYGAIVTNLWAEHHSSIPKSYSGQSIHCDDSHSGRTFADGIGSFFVCDHSRHYLWVPTLLSFSDEASLFSLRDEVLFKSKNQIAHSTPTGSDFIIIQRTTDGNVMIMHWDGIILVRNGAWSSRTYQYKLGVEENLANLDRSVSEKMQDTLRSVLSICLHVLSPRRWGTTIIVALDDDESALSTCLSNHNAIVSPIILTVRRKAHQGPIAHVLSQIDGAAFISESGELRSVGHWLTPRDDDVRERASLGGSRQLTAQATSKLIRSPIITVSADGPVRVFHRGKEIATTNSQAE